MADDVERAEKITREEMERKLAAREAEKSNEPSAYFCDRCDEPIPERRRQAVPGVTKCQQCQSEIEKKGKHNA